MKRPCISRETGGGTPGPPPGGEQWVAPARWTARAGPGSRGRLREHRERWRPCPAHRRRCPSPPAWFCPCSDTAVLFCETQVRAPGEGHQDCAALAPRALKHAVGPCCWTPASARTRARGRIDMAGTLAEKVWADHVVRLGLGEEPDLLYIHLQLVDEVASAQALDGPRQQGRAPSRIDQTLATEDNNTPTIDIEKPIADITSRTQIETLRRNAEEFGVRIHPLGDKDQGIVHVVGPQLGLTMPGITVVCGDSHTSTH